MPLPSPMRESEVAQSCLNLSHPMNHSLPGSSVHGIFQARVLDYLVPHKYPLTLQDPAQKKKKGSSSSVFNLIHRHIATDTWTAAKPCHLQPPPLSLGPGHSSLLEGASPDGPIYATPAGPSSTSLSHKNSASSVFGRYSSDTSCKYLVGIAVSYFCA